MPKYTITVNFNNGKELEVAVDLPGLAEVEFYLNKNYPDASSFVVVWTAA